MKLIFSLGKYVNNLYQLYTKSSGFINKPAKPSRGGAIKMDAIAFKKHLTVVIF